MSRNREASELKTHDLLYMDNAATSWPKPEEVYRAADGALRSCGNPGRSHHGHSRAADRILFDVRGELARFFGGDDPASLVFALNATDALNMAIKGLLETGDHVLISPYEHNSVLRPLHAMARDGMISLSEMACDPDAGVDLEGLPALFRDNTRLVACTHASNVSGRLMPVEEIAAAAHRRGALFLLDAAQTAGVYPVDVDSQGVDLLAFTGHKGLLGPPGVGGLYVRRGIALRPWREGGTGSRSHEVLQPEIMPDLLEAGTMNAPAVAGLGAGLEFIRREGLQRIREHEVSLAGMLREGLREVRGVTVYGPDDPEEGVAVISFTLGRADCAHLGFSLEEEFGILSRTGLHCAPRAHRCLGTFPEGTVRLSPGYFNTEADLGRVLDAVRQIAERAG
ncbi:MAG: aminotransferase class V-fold PLP-dependent enzyme [Bacillota bacterium]